MEIIKPTCPRCGHEIIWENDCMSSDISDEFAQDDMSVTSYLSCKETHESSVRGRNCNNPFIWLNIIFNSHIANIGFFSEKPKIFAKKSLI